MEPKVRSMVDGWVVGHGDMFRLAVQTIMTVPLICVVHGKEQLGLEGF